MTIITRFPSRILVLLTVVVVASFLLLASAVQATDTPGEATALPETTRHKVVVGDTLWDIAAEATDPGEDVRATVYDIKRLNGLDGSLIRPGQVLLVPVG